jgi:hypothetical protein
VNILIVLEPVVVSGSQLSACWTRLLVLLSCRTQDMRIDGLLVLGINLHQDYQLRIDIPFTKKDIFYIFARGSNNFRWHLVMLVYT